MMGHPYDPRIDRDLFLRARRSYRLVFAALTISMVGAVFFFLITTH